MTFLGKRFCTWSWWRLCLRTILRTVLFWRNVWGVGNCTKVCVYFDFQCLFIQNWQTYSHRPYVQCPCFFVNIPLDGILVSDCIIYCASGQFFLLHCSSYRGYIRLASDILLCISVEWSNTTCQRPQWNIMPFVPCFFSFNGQGTPWCHTMHVKVCPLLIRKRCTYEVHTSLSCTPQQEEVKIGVFILCTIEPFISRGCHPSHMCYDRGFGMTHSPFI